MYAAIMRHAEVKIEVHDHYQKQTVRNHCTIAGPNGVMNLTVPVVKPMPDAEMKDVRISDHGNWRHQHWYALRSAYHSSPFFEYYEDDLAPFYERRWDFLVDFNEELMHLMCGLIDMPCHWTRTSEYMGITQDSLPSISPYYQVFQARHGFLPHLSIVDLLFNMGPESILILNK